MDALANMADGFSGFCQVLYDRDTQLLSELPFEGSYVVYFIKYERS